MYIVEGNIGVGKTTFLTLIKQSCPEVEVVAEPVQNWNKQDYGQSLLANFYIDTPRWAYTLETFTMFCRTRSHIDGQKVPNHKRIFERSIYSGHYCFAKNSFESGCMTDLEWKIYNDWANFLIHQQCKPPLGFIYLKASPEVCFERIHKRDRSSEKALTLDYLKQIDTWHNRFLIEKTGLPPKLIRVPVLRLNCNEDFLESSDNMKSHAAKLRKFIQQTEQNRPTFNLGQNHYTLGKWQQ